MVCSSYRGRIGTDRLYADARPDYSQGSTNSRMEISVTAGLGHIHNFMHPQVYIVDESEDLFFVKGIRSKGFETGRSIIELPNNAVQRMMWVTRLDHGSLQGKRLLLSVYRWMPINNFHSMA